MRIPVGNFGNVILEPTPVTDRSQVIEAAGRGIAQVSDVIQQNREAFQRASAATAISTYKDQLDNAATQLSDDLATGKVAYDQADTEWQKRSATVKPPQVQLDNRISRVGMQGALQNVQHQARQSLTPHIYAARQQAGVAQFDEFLDNQAKQAAKPGANVGAINASADAYGAQARQYGIPQNIVDGKVQAFKDANWYNNAMQRAVEADGNLAGLKGVLHDLTDPNGMYADKLDPPKRASLQASVQNQIDRIELRALAYSDRAEVRGQRALVQYERQISSAIPTTPEMVAGWANAVRGTSSQAEFEELAKTERDVQATLKMPIPDQVRMVQEKQAALDQGGGTVAQGANVARLDNAVKSNIKLLTQAPLLYGEERLGDHNVPVDVADLSTPQGRANIAATMNERAARIRALSTQFQTPIPMLPLLPQEAKGLSSLLENASPTQAADLYGILSDAAGDPVVFRGMMQQIAPDSPVRASAGLLAQKQHDLMINSHWFKPDEYVSSRDVAATILEGDRQLNKSSTQKSADGKDLPKLILPQTTLLQNEFAKQVGTIYAGRPDAAQIDFQAVQAYYAGRVAQSGKIAADTEDVDKPLVREAVRAVIGNVVDFNDRGDVAAPWGMAEDDFNDRAWSALTKEAKARGVEVTDGQRSLVGLMNTPTDGLYGVMVGRRLMRDAAGRPVYVDLRQGSPIARGYINRGVNAGP